MSQSPSHQGGVVLAFTQDQLTKLEQAIAQGTLSVKYADKQVTYRSLDEMLKLHAMMKKEIESSTTTPKKKIGVFSKGL